LIKRFSSVDGVPAVSISISSLGSESSSQSSSVPLNQSALIEFNKQLNIQANVRDYLISFTMNLLICTSDSIKLQSSTLSQLTQATNQLTRTTAVRINEIFCDIFYLN
jgi:type III secretory pathway lipoprotein EscJ